MSSSDRRDELGVFLADFADCVERNDDAAQLDRFKAALGDGESAVAVRAARRARTVLNVQRQCVDRAGGEDLEELRSKIDAALAQVGRGYAEMATGIEEIHAGGKGPGFEGGEARLAEGGHRLGSAIAAASSEYLKLGGDDTLITRLRRVI